MVVGLRVGGGGGSYFRNFGWNWGFGVTVVTLFRSAGVLTAGLRLIAAFASSWRLWCASTPARCATTTRSCFLGAGLSPGRLSEGVTLRNGFFLNGLVSFVPPKP